MKVSTLQLAVAVGCLAAAVSACGGDVDLGGKRSPPTGAAGAPQASEPPDSPAGELVLNRPSIRFVSLTAAGDYLYIVGFTETQIGIFRCRTSDCEGTFELFVSGSVGFPEVYGDRLRFISWDDGNYGFSSVALSNGKDEQVVIRGLPGETALPPLFYEDFVYFSLARDRGMYRCSLPTCADRPERLARTSGRSLITPRAEADYLLWFEGSFIYRAAGYGTEPAMALLPDDSLSAAPAAALNPDDAPGDVVDAIDVSNGLVYASVGRSSNGRGCDSFCPHDVVAWPVGGGAVQRFLHSETRLQGLRIFDKELVWLASSNKISNNADAAAIWTCRVEACDETRRALGETTFGYANVVANEHDVYWVAAEPIAPPPGSEGYSGFQLSQIRRTARLPTP